MSPLEEEGTALGAGCLPGSLSAAPPMAQNFLFALCPSLILAASLASSTHVLEPCPWADVLTLWRSPAISLAPLTFLAPSLQLP